MDLHKLREVLNHAGQYHIKCKYERTGDFDYTVFFSQNNAFTNGHKAIKFIDALVAQHGLTRFTKPFTLP